MRDPSFFDLEKRWERTAQRTRWIRGLVKERVLPRCAGVQLIEAPSAYWLNWYFSSQSRPFTVAMPINRVMSDREITDFFNRAIEHAQL